ncbi:Fructose-bisphosphate aldolase 1, chloroplastic [Capsicum chinense]|nr:Fructose-bisphosphate aldolase 1, chloroplastic [Capsicum chinense]
MPCSLLLISVMHYIPINKTLPNAISQTPWDRKSCFDTKFFTTQIGVLAVMSIPKPKGPKRPLSGYGPPTGANDESWCQGLDGSASRAATYSQQGDCFAKWCTVVSIPNGPSTLAVMEAASGLACYTAISQDSGLVPIMDPEVLLDGDHGMYRTFEVVQK